MTDKDSADWKDVLKLREYIPIADSMRSINMYISCLSHVKYLYSKTQKGHELRQKQRTWLKSCCRFQLIKFKKKGVKRNGV